MDSLRYCTHCERDVVAKVKINWIIFVLLLLLFIWPGIFYIIYCNFSGTHRKCPHCGADGVSLEAPRGKNQ